MTATDTIRAMLDERGVEWWQSANTLGCVFTRWYSTLFGDEVCAMENGEQGLVLFDHFVTPEQAIEATLGRGECRDTGNYISAFECDTCGEVYEMYRTPSFCPSCGRKVRA